ncbi:hypothetical protein CHARACLAT_032111 [Characodon lateralis]|uniref:Uncharacterized protein n=1 Tax=Characodon lateralis TaxID=208331 RepID=A0ABU7DWL1_9TELE|nr:hypothetical protein [Characodon lateralis]
MSVYARASLCVRKYICAFHQREGSSAPSHRPSLAIYQYQDPELFPSSDQQKSVVKKTDSRRFALRSSGKKKNQEKDGV